EGVAGGARVAAGVEADVGGRERTPVLVFAVADLQAPGLEGVRALEPGEVVAELDVGGGRQEGPGGAEEARVAADPRVRNAVLEPSPAREELGKGEAVGVSLPGVAEGRDALAIPGRVGLELVHHVR